VTLKLTRTTTGNKPKMSTNRRNVIAALRLGTTRAPRLTI